MDKIKELSGSDNSNGESLNDSSNLANTSRSSQTTTLSITIPDSPPPTYTSLNIQHVEEEENYHKDEETVSISKLLIKIIFFINIILRYRFGLIFSFLFLAPDSSI